MESETSQTLQENAKDYLKYMIPEGSPVHEIAKYRVCSLASPSSLFSQVAHPLVAEGVKQYSSFSRDPIGRRNRTTSRLRALFYATEEEVKQTAHEINIAHRLVKGQLKDETGPHESGKKFNARDPKLSKWVWATITYGYLTSYQKLVGKLTEEQKDQFVRDSARPIQLLGAKPIIDTFPKTYQELDEYMAKMVEGLHSLTDDESGQITVGDTARQITDQVSNPFWWTFGKTEAPIKFLAAGFMHPALREQYFPEWNEKSQQKFDTFCAKVKAISNHLPPAMQQIPQYREYVKRTNHETMADYAIARDHYTQLLDPQKVDNSASDIIDNFATLSSLTEELVFS